MKSNATRHGDGTGWPARAVGAITLGMFVITLAACWVNESDEQTHGELSAEFNRCRDLATQGGLAEALDCFDAYYARQYPSIDDDLRERVIGEYIDCLLEAGEADARTRCDREVDLISEATRETASIMASVEAYDTRVAEEVDEATAIPLEEESAMIPAGRYEGTVDIHTWFFESDREPVTAIHANELWIEIAPDGKVTGSLQVDYDTTFDASSGETLYLSHAHAGTFSGQLDGAEGRIDLSLNHRKEKTSGGEGWLIGDSASDHWVSVRVEDGRLFGTVDADYFTLEAGKR